MFQQVKDFVVGSKPVQIALVFVGGMAVGALFYPTKHIEETLTTKHEEEVKIIKEQHSKELSSKQEELNKVIAESRTYQRDTEKKITSLTTEVHNLKSNKKTAYYKIVKPDGTVEIRKFSESEVTESTQVITQIQSEFKEKVVEIENKWESLHKKRVTEIKKEFSSKEEEYKHTIDELKKTKVVDINKKTFGIEGGLMLNKNAYAHITADLFGPIFFGLQSELGPAPSAGAGFGLRF
jgi:hypothetical protein